MKLYLDKDRLQEYTTKLVAKLKTIFATQAQVGSPLVASTVAEMTDTNKVYVYTGSETGYTAGNWYYNDGSDWVSGGVYNSAAISTDTTLSISGKAADAKATGDAIAGINQVPSGGSTNQVLGKLSNTDHDYGWIAQTGSGESGLTDAMKQALLKIAEKVGYIDANGSTYYDDLYDSFYPVVGLDSISAVFTQGQNVIYNTDSLDVLKQFLVVTAIYEDTTTEVLPASAYTLSGTLTVGTSTITAYYGGKTDTFSVTVTEYTTSPVIDQYNKSMNSDGSLSSKTGSCITKAYFYEIDVESFKDTNYYNSENNYATMDGALFRLFVYSPNSGGVSFGSSGYAKFIDSEGNRLQSASMAFNTTGKSMNAARYNTGYFTLSNNEVGFIFNLSTADIENSYAYWQKALYTNITPIGVSDGDIIFAGENTPYYGLSNINEANAT